jgi:uncharacterized membrane protein YdjX (TVP38/TMEM64 family)
MEEQSHAIEREPAKKRGAKKFFLLIGILALAFVLFRFTPLSSFTQKENLLAFLSSIREEWWGPTIFVLIYGVGCVLALPGSLLTLAGGALFGTILGTFYNVIASNIGATLAFFMARFLGQEFVASLMKGGKLASFDEKIGENGFKIIFRLRLIPVVPFNGLNFGSGFSRIRYRDYLFGSMLGMLPATFIYTYFADALLTGATGASYKAMINLIIASILLITLSFVPAIYKKIQKR